MGGRRETHSTARHGGEEARGSLLFPGPRCCALAWQVVRCGGRAGPAAGGQANGLAFRFLLVGSGEALKALHRAWCEQHPARGRGARGGGYGEGGGGRGPVTVSPGVSSALGPAAHVQHAAPCDMGNPFCRHGSHTCPLLLQEDRGRVREDHRSDDRWVSCPGAPPGPSVRRPWLCPGRGRGAGASGTHLQDGPHPYAGLGAMASPRWPPRGLPTSWGRGSGWFLGCWGASAPGRGEESGSKPRSRVASPGRTPLGLPRGRDRLGELWPPARPRLPS